MANETLPDVAIKKATNLVTDSRLSIAVGLIPLLGLIFILRLVQWYLLRNQFPSLITTGGKHAKLSKDFNAALPRLWFAVLMWPCVFLLLVVLLFMMK